MMETKLQGFWGAFLILSTDFLFVYSIGFLRSNDNLLISQEMDLNFAELRANQTGLAYALGVIAVIIGITADNYNWSFKLSGIGVLFAFVSSCFALSQLLIGIPAGELPTINIGIYVTTSMVRIVVIIGQVTLPDGIEEIRTYIFIMIYSRIIATGLSNLHFKVFQCWFSFLLTLLYCFFFNFYLPRVINYETAHLGVVHKAVTNLLLKFLRWIQIIRLFKCKEGKNSIAKFSFSKKNLIDFKEIKDLKVKTISMEPAIPPTGVEPTPTKQEDFVASQGQKFCKIFPIFLLGVSFSVLNYYVFSVTTFQAEYVKSVHVELLGKVEIASFFIVSKIIAYAVTEYFFLPSLKDNLKRDLLQFAFGYFILLLAYLASTYVQFNAINHAEYALPKKTEVQLRFYNAMDYNITACVNSLNVELDIGPFHFKNVIIPYHNQYNLSIHAKGRTVNFTTQRMKEMSTINIIYEKNRITLSPQEDPNISGIREDHYFAYCQIHVLNLQDEKLVLASSRENKTFSAVVNSTGMYAFEPGRFEDKSGNRIDLKSGVLYSALLLKWEETVDVNWFYLEGPNPITMVHLLPQVMLESMASAIATPSFFRFLYTESPSKMRCTTFSTFMSVGFFLLPIASSDVIESFAQGAEDEMLFFALIHILALFLVVLSDKYFPYEFSYY